MKKSHVRNFHAEPPHWDRTLKKINNWAENRDFSWRSECLLVSLHTKNTYIAMQETRQNKISRLLQKELSQIFQEQTRAMHGVMVSVTQVRVSPDLGICTAHLSIFPSERAEELLQNINRNNAQIRYTLGQRVRHQLRIIPELRFFQDDSLDYIDRIDELLGAKS